ncbi:unnamed protein product [Pseudo-nitzschia multistriata]|uniref:Uncharacterized protein n=1 Tax=Pseudo-nitzschia multistriata TaxID=183589 RepID=A0A448ZRE5_9STRA|nr:unnamed protein product [Pseudo-nitzschia multistriata]
MLLAVFQFSRKPSVSRQPWSSGSTRRASLGVMYLSQPTLKNIRLEKVLSPWLICPVTTKSVFKLIRIAAITTKKIACDPNCTC